MDAGMVDRTRKDKGHDLLGEGTGLRIRTDMGYDRHLSPLMNGSWPPLSKISSRDTYDARTGLVIERVSIPPGAAGTFRWNAPLPHGRYRDSTVHVWYRRDRDAQPRHSGHLSGPTERQDWKYGVLEPAGCCV